METCLLRVLLKRDEEYVGLVEASLSALSKTTQVERHPGLPVIYSVRSDDAEYKVYVGPKVFDGLPVAKKEHSIMISWGSLPVPFATVPSSNITYFDLNFGIHSANLDTISLSIKKCLEGSGFRLLGFSSSDVVTEPRSRFALITRGPMFLYGKMNRRFHSTRDLISMRTSKMIIRPVMRTPPLSDAGKKEEIVVRQATEDDLPQVFERFREILLVRPRHRMMRRCLQYFGDAFLVAEREGAIIGFSFCKLNLTINRFRLAVDGLLNMGVVGEYRNLGVGGRLLSQTIQRLTTMRVRSIRLVVDSDNDAAISMLRHSGFEETTALSEGRREYTLQLGKKT